MQCCVIYNFATYARAVFCKANQPVLCIFLVQYCSHLASVFIHTTWLELLIRSRHIWNAINYVAKMLLCEILFALLY